MTPVTLNSPEALRGRELAVSGVEGICWQVVGLFPGSNRRMATSRVRLRSVPNQTVHEVLWRDLRAQLVAGVVVVR